MATTKRAQQLPSPLENFTRGLLATTCLTVACGVSATAGTVTETPYSNPTPPQFPTTPNGFLLPVGTTEVTGYVVGGEAAYNPAFFEFQGLTPGASYTFSSPTSPMSEMGLRFYNDSGPVGPPNPNLGFIDLGEGGAYYTPLTLNAPSDGNLIVEAEGFGEIGYHAYTLDVTPNASTPEPATVGAVGLGLGAVALVWRRRRAS